MSAFPGGILLLASLVLSAGCASLPGQRLDNGMAGFSAWPEDPRIQVEDGTVDPAYARRVSALLEPAITRVESLHGLPFRQAPRVYLCGTPDCFRGRVRTPKTVAAVVPEHRLVLSPALNDKEASRLEGILIHELSHLHFGQRVGHYSPWVPVWFHEGLATLAAQGGGAEFASDEAAGEAWQAGRQIGFMARDTPDRRHRAADFGLSVHEFYRQAWRMVERLQRQDPAAFRAWLMAMQSGADFHIAFAEAYRTDFGVLMAESPFSSLSSPAH